MSARAVDEPQQHWLPGLVSVIRRDADEVQLLATAAIVGVCWLTIEPQGWTGHGLATVLMLILNTGLLLTRHLPDEIVSTSNRMILLWLGVLAGAALIALGTSGPPYLFAFYAAGHAGFRLSAERAVPIAVADSVLCGGVLLLHIGPGHLLTPWFVGAATGFAVLIGMTSRSRQQALSSALAAATAAERAAAAEAREAVLNERGRIARDVHDVLAHSLAGINMQLELADALLEGSELDSQRVDRVRQATRAAQSLVREGLVESQRTVRALREDTLPLLDTLRSMLASSASDGVLEIVGAERDVETRPAQALVRITQEALTNVAKHAPGAVVTVTVTFGPGVVELTVVNDATAEINQRETGEGSGMGLVGMRERAALLSGSVTVGPVATVDPGASGWRVHAIIPA